jgi:hypothetical protein
MLRKGDGRLAGDLGLGRRGIDDKDERLARALAQINRGTHGAQIMRARTGRHDNQFGDRYDALNSHGDSRRGINHRQLEALLPQNIEVRGEARDRCLGKSGIFALALIPPIGKAALRIDIDQHNRPCSGELGLNGEMAGKCSFPRPTFL